MEKKLRMMIDYNGKEYVYDIIAYTALQQINVLEIVMANCDDALLKWVINNKNGSAKNIIANIAIKEGDEINKFNGCTLNKVTIDYSTFDTVKMKITYRENN